VIAADGPSAGSTTGTTTAATTTATTATTATTGTTPTLTLPRTPRVARVGVRIGGVDVSGLSTAAAAAVVRSSFDDPLVILVNGRTLVVPPTALGAQAKVLAAVERALRAPPGANVWLGVAVNKERVDVYLRDLARRFDRAAVDSRLKLHNLRPLITKDVKGRVLDRPFARQAIVAALEKNLRKPIHLRLKETRAATGRDDFGPVIVIRRGSNRLYLYDGMRFKKRFGVATGASEFPTPLGRYQIVVKWRNPWWYPPDSDWAKGKEPVPPGPGNPLGTRWMGISAPAVGIHGTPDAASIGYSASHGCIRMRIPEAEWIFEHVEVGTPVFIVPA